MPSDELRNRLVEAVPHALPISTKARLARWSGWSASSDLVLEAQAICYLRAACLIKVWVRLASAPSEVVVAEIFWTRRLGLRRSHLMR